MVRLICNKKQFIFYLCSQKTNNLDIELIRRDRQLSRLLLLL